MQKAKPGREARSYANNLSPEASWLIQAKPSVEQFVSLIPLSPFSPPLRFLTNLQDFAPSPSWHEGGYVELKLNLSRSNEPSLLDRI
jgi:hypothetical protein